MKSQESHDHWQARIVRALKRHISPEDLKDKPLDELVGEISVYHQELEYQNQELIRTQEELEASREHYISLFRDAPIAYVVVDEQYRIIDANHEFSRLIGDDTDSAIGTSFQQWMAPESQDDLYFHFRRMADHSMQNALRVHVQNPNGQRIAMLRCSRFADSGSTQIRISLADITARMQAETRLSEANQRLLTVLSSVDALIFVSDMETDEILFSNPQLERLAGNIVGTKCWQSLQKGASDRCSFCPKAKLRDESGQPTGTHASQYFNTKQQKWYDCRDTALRWTDGRIVHLQAAWDITERMETAEQLRRSEQRYRNIVENITDALFIHDFSGRILDVNEAACDQLGYERDELIGATLSMLHSPLERNVLTERAQKVLEQGSLLFEGEFLRKDGSMLVAEVSVKVVDDQGAGVVHAFARNTAQRRQAEEALKRFRIALDSSPDSVFIIHRQTMRFVDVNATSCRELGYPRDELLAIGPHDIKPDYSQAALAKRFDEILAQENRAGVIQTIHRRKDGTTYPAEVFLKGFQSNEGPMLIASARDVSERLQAEAQLAEYTRSIERIQAETENLNRQLNEEFRRAQVIHQSVLPQRLPSAPEMSLAAYFQPAALVGGDFYNVVRSGDNLVFYVSDVSGHGLEGALVSVFFKEAIASYLELGDRDPSPESIMEHVFNQYRKNAYPDDYFIAFFLAVLDLTTYELRYAGAGFQESMLVRCEDGQVWTRTACGLPLSNAIEPTMVAFTPESFTLKPGSTILVNTDGLTEQRVNGEAFHPRRHDVFSQYSHLPPVFLQQALNRSFREFNAGSRQGVDDITYLIVQRQPVIEHEQVLYLQSHFAELDRLDREMSECIMSFLQGDMLTIGLRELVSNAIEHGNQFDTNKQVVVHLTVTPRHLFASVEDEGEGFDWSAKISQPMDLQGIRDRGRGIALARMACHQLVYDERGTKAILCVTREP